MGFMVKFRKKPIVIEAIQWTGDNVREVFSALDLNEASISKHVTAGIEITTLEGVMTAAPGDWIIKGIKGELYPCKPDIFEATYEPAE